MERSLECLTRLGCEVGSVNGRWVLDVCCLLVRFEKEVYGRIIYTTRSVSWCYGTEVRRYTISS